MNKIICCRWRKMKRLNDRKVSKYVIEDNYRDRRIRKRE
jgi:hypothetical protein